MLKVRWFWDWSLGKLFDSPEIFQHPSPQVIWGLLLVSSSSSAMFSCGPVVSKTRLISPCLPFLCSQPFFCCICEQNHFFQQQVLLLLQTSSLQETLLSKCSSCRHFITVLDAFLLPVSSSVSSSAKWITRPLCSCSSSTTAPFYLESVCVCVIAFVSVLGSVELLRMVAVLQSSRTR